MMGKRLSSLEENNRMNTWVKVQKERDKEEEKRWGTAFEGSLTLADALAPLAKNDLSAIRSRLAVRGLSSLNKQQLAAALEQQIPLKLPELLYKLDETRHKALRQIADRGGLSAASLESELYLYFQEVGVLYTGSYQGDKVLAMPQEVLECFRMTSSAAYRDAVRSNTELIQLVQGMLYYYGYLDLVELERLLSRYLSSEIKLSEKLSVLEEAERYDAKFKIVDGGIYYYKVANVEQIRKEQQLRADLSYYAFTKQELLAAGDANFVDRNLVFKGMVGFINDNYEISEAEATVIVEKCMSLMRGGEVPVDVMAYLQTLLDVDSYELLEGFTGHVSMLSNATKQWGLKGHTPLEAATDRNQLSGEQSASNSQGNVIDFASRQKVGRNEPCPCESGKKFKKCCGA